jgi:predicted LPLAT superfamily acyltransferase
MQRRRVSLDSQAVPDWIAQPERGNRLALLAYVRLALALGRPAARVLLYPVCVYFLVFAAKARAASRTYLRKALAREPRLTDLYRHFLTFASTILDRVFLLKGRYSEFEVRTHGEEIVADLVAQGGGCFLLGAHMGSFEVVRALGGDAHGLRVSLVMYEENARKLSSVLNAIKPDIAPRIIALGKMDAMLKVEQALERSEFVGMLGDRTIAGEGTMTCPFMGDHARFPLGPFRLAAMLERPIVLMFGLYRGGNRYDIHFERLAVATQGLARDALIEQAVRSYVARLEHYCRLAPYNWFNFYDYWDKRS